MEEVEYGRNFQYWYTVEYRKDGIEESGGNFKKGIWSTFIRFHYWLGSKKYPLKLKSTNYWKGSKR